MRHGRVRKRGFARPGAPPAQPAQPATGARLRRSLDRSIARSLGRGEQRRERSPAQGLGCEPRSRVYFGRRRGALSATGLGLRSDDGMSAGDRRPEPRVARLAYRIATRLRHRCVGRCDEHAARPRRCGRDSLLLRRTSRQRERHRGQGLGERRGSTRARRRLDRRRGAGFAVWRGMDTPASPPARDARLADHGRLTRAEELSAVAMAWRDVIAPCCEALLG